MKVPNPFKKKPSAVVDLADRRDLADALDREQKRSDKLTQEVQRLQARGQSRRVGFKKLDPIDLTAQLRGRVDSTINVDYDGRALTVHCDRRLSESEYNLVVSILGFELNRT